jgi:hypothetical protein
MRRMITAIALGTIKMAIETTTKVIIPAVRNTWLLS